MGNLDLGSGAMLWRAKTRLLRLLCIGAESCWRSSVTLVCINLRLATCEYQAEPFEPDEPDEPNDAQDPTSSHE